MKFGPVLDAITLSCVNNNRPFALIGEPGIGKSSYIEALAQKLDTRCFTLQVNELSDRGDLTAPRLLPNPEKTTYEQYFFPHVVISQAIQYAKDHPDQKPILFLDEINRAADTGITSAALSIPTARTIGAAPLPKNLRVAIAGNDRGDVQMLDGASVSRFVMLHVTPDATTFMEVMGDRLHPTIKQVLTEHPELILSYPDPSITGVGEVNEDEDGDEDGEEDVNLALGLEDKMYQFSTPRTIEKLNDFLNDTSAETMRQLMGEHGLTVNGKDTTALTEALQAYTGQTAFTEEVEKHLMVTLNTQATAQAPSFHIPKPAQYDQMVSQGSMTDLDDFLQNSVKEEDRDALLLYALQDPIDRSAHVSRLVSLIQSPQPATMQLFVQLITAKPGQGNQQPNKQALQALQNVNAQPSLASGLSQSMVGLMELTGL